MARNSPDGRNAVTRGSHIYNSPVKQVEREPQLTAYDLKRRLNGHSQRIGVPSYAIRATAETAHEAWQRTFRRLAGRPRLKGRRRPLVSIPFDFWRYTPNGRRITIPTLGPVRFHPQEIPAGHIGHVRIMRRASGWYLCLFIQAEPKAIERTGDGEVGIDPGFASLLTLSNGEKINPQSEWQRTARRLGQAQRGSKLKLTARLHERIANQRRNRNHHISRRLVAENRLIAFSADRHNAIARRFGKSVMGAGHYQLRSMLRYKCSPTGGAEYIEVPSRNSTKTCSACGALSGPSGFAGLSVRTWTCGCGAIHERDVNAALNTLRLGLERASERRREAAPGTAPRKQHCGVQRAGVSV